MSTASVTGRSRAYCISTGKMRFHHRYSKSRKDAWHETDWCLQIKSVYSLFIIPVEEIIVNLLLIADNQQFDQFLRSRNSENYSAELTPLEKMNVMLSYLNDVANFKLNVSNNWTFLNLTEQLNFLIKQLNFTETRHVQKGNVKNREKYKSKNQINRHHLHNNHHHHRRRNGRLQNSNSNFHIRRKTIRHCPRYQLRTKNPWNEIRSTTTTTTTGTVRTSLRRRGSEDISSCIDRATKDLRAPKRKPPQDRFGCLGQRLKYNVVVRSCFGGAREPRRHWHANTIITHSFSSTTISYTNAS